MLNKHYLDYFEIVKSIDKIFFMKYIYCALIWEESYCASNMV